MLFSIPMYFNKQRWPTYDGLTSFFLQNSEALWTRDRYQQTALDIAKRKHCKLAERILIYATLRRKCPIPLSAKVRNCSSYHIVALSMRSVLLDLVIIDIYLYYRTNNAVNIYYSIIRINIIYQNKLYNSNAIQMVNITIHNVAYTVYFIHP